MTLGPNDQRLDAYVPLTKLRKATVFKLKVVPESMTDEYSVFVRADRKADLFLGKFICFFQNTRFTTIEIYCFYSCESSSVTKLYCRLFFYQNRNLI